MGIGCVGVFTSTLYPQKVNVYCKICFGQKQLVSACLRDAQGVFSAEKGNLIDLVRILDFVFSRGKSIIPPPLRWVYLHSNQI